MMRVVIFGKLRNQKKISRSPERLKYRAHA